MIDGVVGSRTEPSLLHFLRFFPFLSESQSSRFSFRYSLPAELRTKKLVPIQYRQENLTTFPNFPYYCENRKRWIYLGAPMVDPANLDRIFLHGLRTWPHTWFNMEKLLRLFASWSFREGKHGKLAMIRKGGVYWTPGQPEQISIV